MAGIAWVTRLWRAWVSVASPAAAPTVRQAVLVNTQGTVDSVRTIVGTPPVAIRCAAGTYRLDRSMTGEHYWYRRDADLH